MKTKRILCILLVLVMCITAFAGCKENTNDDVSSTAGSSDEFFDFEDNSDVDETDSSAESDTQSTDSSDKSSTSKKPTTQSSNKGNGDITQELVDEFVWPKINVKSKELTILSPYEPSDETKKLLKEKYGINKVTMIDVTWHEMSTRLAAVTMAGQSPDVIYYRQDNPDFPSYIYKGFVKPIDDLVEWNHMAYKDLLWHYGKTKIGGKNYLLISGFTGGPIVTFNKRMFKDAGVTDPWTLYKQGKWDWNKLLEICPQLCVDTNGDDAVDQMALAIGEAYSLMYTTGQTYGSIDDANKTCKNNIKNRNIARAMNFQYDLIYKYGYSMRGITQNDSQFAEELVAMSFNPCNGDVFMEEFAKLRKRGDLGLCPMPKDPNASKLYYYTRMSAYFVGKDAKNPQGAVAMNAVERFYELDKTRAEESKKSMKKNYNFTNEMIEQYYESVRVGTPVLELTPFIGYVSTWNCLQEGTPWATQVSADASSIQSSIDSVFAKE